MQTVNGNLGQSTRTSCVYGSSYEETVKDIETILRPSWYMDAEYNKISKLEKEMCESVGQQEEGKKGRRERENRQQ